MGGAGRGDGDGAGAGTGFHGLSVEWRKAVGTVARRKVTPFIPISPMVRVSAGSWGLRGDRPPCSPGPLLTPRPGAAGPAEGCRQ